MKLNLYIVRDRILEQSSAVSEAKNDAVALRNFEKVMAGNEFRSDFDLYQIGWFDHDADRGGFLGEPRLVCATMSTEVEDDG